MQFQADILGVPVVRPKVAETTALGAAYLAGLAVGYWRDAGELAANWQIDRRFEPAMSRDEAASLMAGWTRAVDRAKRWAV
jgi:glycerol kinase